MDSPVSNLTNNLRLSSISTPNDNKAAGSSTPVDPPSKSGGRSLSLKVATLNIPDENTCPQQGVSLPSPRTAQRKLFPELDSPASSRKNKSSHDDIEPNKRLAGSDPGPNLGSNPLEDTPSPAPSPTPIRQKLQINTNTGRRKLSQSTNSWSFSDIARDSTSCPTSPLTGRLPPRPPTRTRSTTAISSSPSLQDISSVWNSPVGSPLSSLPPSPIQQAHIPHHFPIEGAPLVPVIIIPPKREDSSEDFFPMSPVSQAEAILPHTEKNSVKYIDPETLHEVLDGKYNCRHIIIDCRFKFEYDGGHIIGAINITEKEQLEPTFFKNVDPMENCVLIFHCEFSAYRGPNTYQHLRNLDRAANIDCYPKLTYPNAYVLQGGYKRFFEEYQNYCFPQSYVTMDDPQFSTERKDGLTSLRRGKSLKGQRYRSFSDLRSLRQENDF